MKLTHTPLFDGNISLCSSISQKIQIGGRMSVWPETVILLKANQNYTELYLNNGTMLLVATTLKVLEERFRATKRFFRPDRSHVINLNYMTDYEKNENKIIMYNQQEVLISRRRKDRFNMFLEENFNSYKRLLP